MPLSSSRPPFPWACVFIALMGAAYCAVLASPLESSIPCPSSGCRLFRDVAIHGVSLWWVGCAYFVTVLVLGLFRAVRLVHALALLALFIDALLLLVMLGSVPCVTCLGAALFLGVVFLQSRKHMAGLWTKPRRSVLFLVWCGLFVAASASALMEQAGRWSLIGEEHIERRVYFAPSCPACRDAVAVFADNAEFIPVAERESDYAAIYRMHKAVTAGVPIVSALAASGTGDVPEPYMPEMLLLRLRLLRNKADVMRLGFEALPLITINGMPQTLRHVPATDGAASSTPARPRANGALPPELLDKVDSCGGGNQEPCDPPQGAR